MTVLTTHARQSAPYLPLRDYRLLRLVSVMQELAGWYRQRMNQRALEGISITDLKDIGYPTACRDELSVRKHED